MKIVTDNTTTIERIGVGDDCSFKINFDAKMARILADGLYSDKVQSVIRELSCNAVDSHVAAGYGDRPIEVHFPNRFEPWFHVRDFGTGLSHAEVLGIYTTYGASTKTNSNDYVGQLGLGSKSPFALADAFTVTTRKDGVENHYSMYRNEHGMPSVAHLHSKPTTDANGVCVTVPVRSDQRDEFVAKAREVYKWFPVKPNVVGDNITYPAIEYAYQGTGWGIRKPTNHSRGYYGHRNVDRPVAIMGLVAYPLDAASIKGLPAGASHLMSTPVVLNFAIGELEVAANREALGYDDRTCANIVTHIEVMIRELGERFEQEITGAKSMWYARQKFGEIFNKGDYAYEFDNAYKNLGLKWKNEVVKGTTCTINLEDLYPKIKVGTHDQVDYSILESTWRYKRPRKVSTSYNSTNYAVECEANTVVMFNDLKLGGMTRVMEFNKQHDNKKNVVIFNPSTKANWDKIRKALGNPDVVYTSSLPKPPRKEAVRTGMLEYTGSGEGKRYWKSVEIDLDAGGYYVVLDGWDVMHGERRTSDLGWYIRTAAEVGIIPTGTKVYAMRNKNRKIVAEHASWKNLFDTVKTKLMEKISSMNLAEAVAKADAYRSFVDRSVCEYWRQFEFGTRIKAADSPALAFGKMVQDYKLAVQNDKLDTIRALTDRFDIKVEFTSNQPLVNLSACYAELVQRYPMISVVSKRLYYGNPIDSGEWKMVFDYINLVDATAVFMSLQDRADNE